METNGRITVMATAFLLLVGLPAITSAKIIYVAQDARGTDDGTSWTNAFVHLQRALAIGKSGDEIRVAQGLYRPDQDALVPKMHGTVFEVDPSAGPNAHFELMNGVTLKGGFAGFGVADPNDRDVERYRTILSGDLHGNDVDAWGLGHPMYESLRQDNSSHVVYCHKVDPTTVLDGVTIQSARRSGMHNWDSSPQVIQCTFRLNSGLDFSGGAFHSQGGQPTFIHCTFQENATKMVGGAIYASTARVMLSECRFVNNWAASPGGAIGSVDSDVVAADCAFQENASDMGGALYHQQGVLELANCTFESNMARQKGGAISLLQQEAASVTGCTFRRNSAPKGGAIVNEGIPLLIERCAFSGNRALGGGAIYAMGPSALDPTLQAAGTTMTRCLFTGNHADDAGGAIWGYRAEFTMGSCTLADNWARTCATIGRWTRQTTETELRVAMENCIVWDGNNSMVAARSSVEPVVPSVEAGVEITVRYSDVQGGWPGAGNIDTDPLFSDPGRWVDAAEPALDTMPDDREAKWVEGDYHLNSRAGRRDPMRGTWVLDEVTSPCIDTGDPNAPVANEPEPNGGQINMGAYGGTAEASRSQ